VFRAFGAVFRAFGAVFRPCGALFRARGTLFRARGTLFRACAAINYFRSPLDISAQAAYTIRYKAEDRTIIGLGGCQRYGRAG
jgi:hypothetical protein